MAKDLNWGIIGAGNIARALAHALAHTEGSKLVAVASRTQEKAQDFVEKLGDPGMDVRAVGSYEQLIADKEIDVVYIATPHTFHAEWTIRALREGKHILCEKPAALNAAEAMAMIEAAHESGRFFMEAFMYRCHPQTNKILELVSTGALGEITLIEASFGWPAPKDESLRFYSNELAGGGILDVGLYPVSLARLVAGAANGKPFLNPGRLVGGGKIAPTGVDDHAAAVLSFEGGITAQVSTAFDAMLPNTAQIFGTKGNLYIPKPWHPTGSEPGTAKMVLTDNSGQSTEIDVPASKGLFVYEVEEVTRAINAGLQSCGRMSWEDTLGNMRTLDRWRASIKQAYKAETQSPMRPPMSGLPLRAPSKTTRAQVKGLAKPISRLVMGCDNQTTKPHAAALFDDYFERGGNCFDTAHLYGGGIMERLLGEWIATRGVREDVVLIGKGAHTPDCYPEAVHRQLDETLNRLQTDNVDIYFLHRDNPDIPISEWLDALNQERDAGRITVFGGSNWTIDRLTEANAQAEQRGVQGFTVLSNNFSLARMVNPVWPGVLACSEAAYRDYLLEAGMALFPWSSQARGFFTDAASPEKLSDKELVNAWYSPANFQRRGRAIELAEKKGVTPMAIAAAYVLAQPFPTFPLIGPRALSETRTSFAALDIELTSDECTWLEGDLSVT